MSSEQNLDTDQTRGVKRSYPSEAQAPPRASLPPTIAAHSRGIHLGLQPSAPGPAPDVRSQKQQQPHEQQVQRNDIPLRTGQWTPEEIAFANKVIEYFDQGSLPNCNNGTTLRALLANILHCSPMRISKKFAGDGAIGKRTFTKHGTITQEEIEQLRRLEQDFHESIQGRGRWPLVHWNTLLLGRKNNTSGTIPIPNQAIMTGRGAEQRGEYQSQTNKGPRPIPSGRGIRLSLSPHNQQQQQQPVLGAPGPRPPWIMSPPPLPAPPRQGREVRHTLSKLKEHCAPITLERLAAEQIGTTDQNLHSSDVATHADIYGWVPSELGIPDTDPIALAQILDAERNARPFTDDIARQSHFEQMQALQGPIIYSPHGNLDATTPAAAQHISQQRRDILVPPVWDSSLGTGTDRWEQLPGGNTAFSTDDPAYHGLSTMRRPSDSPPQHSDG